MHACVYLCLFFFFFFFNDTATTEIYTLSPTRRSSDLSPGVATGARSVSEAVCDTSSSERSEEHTSELQSPVHIVCRLLLEKKKTHNTQLIHIHTKQLYTTYKVD